MTPAELKKELGGSPPRGAYLLTASKTDAYDVFLADGCESQIIDAALPPEERAANVSQFDGDEFDVGGFIDACQTLTMFGETSVVVLRRVEALNADAQQTLLGAIERLPDSTVLVLCAAKLDGRQRFGKELKKQCAVIGVDTPQEPDVLARWAMHHCAGHKKTLDKGLAMEMAKKVTGLTALIQLVDQAISCVGDATDIDRSVVDQLWRSEPEDNVFAITDALAERNASGALGAAAEAERAGAHYLQLLALIEAALRRMIGVREGMDENLSDDAIAERLGIKRGAVYHQRQRAGAWSMQDLRAVHSDVLALEYNMKAGGGDPRLRLESFLVSACS